MRVLSIVLLSLTLAACASVATDPEPPLPEGAIPATRTEANGDVITEYRLAGQLKMVKVVPARGVTFYIYDRNGDGVINERDARNGPLTYYKLFSW